MLTRHIRSRSKTTSIHLSLNEFFKRAQASRCLETDVRGEKRHFLQNPEGFAGSSKGIQMRIGNSIAMGKIVRIYSNQLTVICLVAEQVLQAEFQIIMHRYADERDLVRLIYFTLRSIPHSLEDAIERLHVAWQKILMCRE